MDVTAISSILSGARTASAAHFCLLGVFLSFLSMSFLSGQIKQKGKEDNGPSRANEVLTYRNIRLRMAGFSLGTSSFPHQFHFLHFER